MTPLGRQDVSNRGVKWQLETLQCEKTEKDIHNWPRVSHNHERTVVLTEADSS